MFTKSQRKLVKYFGESFALFYFILVAILQPFISSNIYYILDLLIVVALVAELTLHILWSNRYWTTTWDIMYFFIILDSVAYIVLQVLPNNLFFAQEFITMVTGLISTLRMLKFALLWDGVTARLRTFVRMIPLVCDYAAGILLISYAFAIVGMELMDNELGEDGVFNDLVSTLIYLFEVLMMANYNSVLYKAISTFGTYTIFLYWLTFYTICVIIILNILLAILLEFNKTVDYEIFTIKIGDSAFEILKKKDREAFELLSQDEKQKDLLQELRQNLGQVTEKIHKNKDE